ncbi:MAG: transposase family protein [Actinomycetota bacterium]|nr:transposase family protein [Actinomycetota bacterium]
MTTQRAGQTVGLPRRLVLDARARPPGDQVVPAARGRPWGLPLPVRLLLVLIHLRTNLTTRDLAALFTTSQSTAHPVIHHLVAVLAVALRPEITSAREPWTIDSGDGGYPAHRRIRAHVEHVTATIKDWQILRQCRRRSQAINHSLQIVAGLLNQGPRTITGQLLSP